MRRRMVGLTVALLLFFWGFAALQRYQAQSRAEELRFNRSVFGLPQDATIVSNTKRSHGWGQGTQTIDFRLPGQRPAEHKLMLQAERMHMLDCRKSRYLFRSPSTDFGYRQVEYRPSAGLFRITSVLW